MSTLEDLRTKVIAIVKDTSGKLVNPTDYDAKITAALNRYSKLRPDKLVEDVAGSGTSDLDLPEGWVDEFSTIKSIEYPVGDNPESILDADEYALYRSPDGEKIRLRSDSPAATEVVRIAYTVPRSATTVPAVDVEAVCSLAAALCLEDLANAAVQTADPTMSADVVNYRTKSGEFASRAKRLMQLYKDHLGLKEDDTTPPASAVADFDEKYPGGLERLTHPRWARERR